MTPTVPHTVREALSRDHERLYARFDALLEGSDAGVDPRTLRDLWNAFEDDLRRHMEVEEMLVFPALRHEHDAAVAQLVTEHGQLRALLDLVGVEIELHLARAPEVHDLIDLLRAHAAREDATAYAAADQEIDEKAWERLVRDIESRLTQG